ncbi:ATP-binding protein [Coprobacillaceae bacterium CR2/5/TPMF4]|nr:ATP-binding protein [Coprobacillaceae bacterium CR2/5/TPMF4]
MHIILQFSWSLCLDESVFSVFCVDEAHLLILAGETAKMIEQFVRRSRKYNNATILATQEPHDFADPAIITSGKAIFNSSAYKIIMNLEKDGISDLMKLTALTQGELSLIQGFHMGEAILIAGNKRIPVQIQITDEMFSVME